MIHCRPESGPEAETAFVFFSALFRRGIDLPRGRFVCLGAAVLALLLGLLKTVTNLRGFASVGVIGGADGPTAIFIAGPQIFDWADVIAAGVVLVLGLAGYFILRRLPPKKNG